MLERLTRLFARPPRRVPPGPSPRELVPRILQMQRDPLGFLLELSERYDKIAYFEAGSLPVYVIHDPDGIKHVLQEQATRYTKDTIQYRALATITGNGLLTSDGPLWRRHRKAAQRAFAKPRIAKLDEIVVPAATDMLARWAGVASSGRVLDVQAEMMELALEIVGKALFSVNMRRDAPRLTGAVLTALDTIVHRARSVIALPSFVPTPQNLRFARAMRVLDDAVAELLRDRRRSGALGDDLLGILLAFRDEETGEGMTDVQIRDEILTMLIAGHETVASALTWTFDLLGRHPAARTRLHEEVCDVVGSARPDGAAVGRLAYTAQVFSEALRLYPPAWVITRKALGGDELLGYPVARGALVIISPYVVHRLASHWDDPTAFAPERFAPDTGRGRHRFAYLPFGGGPRLCIGDHFAQMEGALVLCAVSQSYWLEPVTPGPPKMDALVTLRPRGGMRMRVRRY